MCLLSGNVGREKREAKTTKNFVIAILITFVPVILAGCGKKDVATSNWQGHLEDIEKAREERKNTKRKELVGKVTFMEKKLTIEDYYYAQSILKSKASLYKRVVACFSKKMSIEDTRNALRG